MNPEIPYNKETSTQASVLSIKDWLIIFIIGVIPIVNIVMLFVWAFGGNANPNKSNYSKAALILAAIVIGLYIVFLVLFFVIFGMAGMSGMFDEYN